MVLLKLLSFGAYDMFCPFPLQIFGARGSFSATCLLSWHMLAPSSIGLAGQSTRNGLVAAQSAATGKKPCFLRYLWSSIPNLGQLGGVSNFGSQKWPRLIYAKPSFVICRLKHCNFYQIFQAGLHTNYPYDLKWVGLQPPSNGNTLMAQGLVTVGILSCDFSMVARSIFGNI